jgi:hypothetical protein
MSFTKAKFTTPCRMEGCENKVAPFSLTGICTNCQTVRFDEVQKILAAEGWNREDAIRRRYEKRRRQTER